MIAKSTCIGQATAGEDAVGVMCGLRAKMLLESYVEMHLIGGKSVSLVPHVLMVVRYPRANKSSLYRIWRGSCHIVLAVPSWWELSGVWCLVSHCSRRTLWIYFASGHWNNMWFHEGICMSSLWGWIQCCVWVARAGVLVRHESVQCPRKPPASREQVKTRRHQTAWDLRPTRVVESGRRSPDAAYGVLTA